MARLDKAQQWALVSMNSKCTLTMNTWDKRRARRINRMFGVVFNAHPSLEAVKTNYILLTTSPLLVFCSFTHAYNNFVGFLLWLCDECDVLVHLPQSVPKHPRFYLVRCLDPTFFFVDEHGISPSWWKLWHWRCHQKKKKWHETQMATVENHMRIIFQQSEFISSQFCGEQTRKGCFLWLILKHLHYSGTHDQL